MTNKQLEEELNKNKFFIIKYSILINIIIFSLIFLILSIIKINESSLLILIFKYYTNKN